MEHRGVSRKVLDMGKRVTEGTSLTTELGPGWPVPFVLLLPQAMEEGPESFLNVP